MSEAVENAALPATLLDEGTYLEPFGSHRGIQLYGVNKQRSLERAARKLAEVRAGKVKAVAEHDFSKRLKLSILLSLAGALLMLPFMGLSLWLQPDRVPTGTANLVILLILPFSVFATWRRMHSGEPVHVLGRYLGFAAAQQWQYAPPIVAPNDLDAEPRFVPKVADHCIGGAQFNFSDALGQERYWNLLLNNLDLSRRRFVRILQCKETRLADDLTMVQCECRFWRWRWLYLVLWIIPAMIGSVAFAVTLGRRLGDLSIYSSTPFVVAGFYFSAQSVRVRLNKLLINIDGKWKVFNGELQGYEELDLSWLPVNGTRWSDVEKVSVISLRGADSKPGMVVPAAAT